MNTYTKGHQRAPSVAMHADGHFVVVWQSAGQDGSGYSVYGKLFRRAATGPQ